MEDRTKLQAVKATVSGGHHVEKLQSKDKLYLGIDIGSTSSDVIVLDEHNNIIFSDYQRTAGRPIATVSRQLDTIFKQINPSDIALTSVTGSAGRLLAELDDITFINEVTAQAKAIGRLYPQFPQATIIEMGGQDSKLIFISQQNGKSTVRDFSLNTVCAAGTGSFLDQQAQRLGVDIEKEFGQLALVCKTVPRIAGRCSVFAKSDMIHLQQQATPNCDIVAGLCLALARNLKSNLGCGRKFVRPIIFTGGVAANIGVVRSIEKVLELPEGRLIVPKQHFFTGAIGAVLVAKAKDESKRNGKLNLKKINDYLHRRDSGLTAVPKRAVLRQPQGHKPQSKVHEQLLENITGPINAYLGVDVGSISTNITVIDEQKRVLAKAYLMTAGKPLEAIRQGLGIVADKVLGKVKILAAASTGSGRYLTGDFIGADIVINEITAQATGAAIVNPKVDTIFEIGGQDSKYISLENGVVVDFEMNHACAAGTGSFLEEQAQRLGININNEFTALAMASKAPIKLGERCTVFMESDLLSCQQQGAQTRDLLAGLSYSIVANYLNRVVGQRKIGDNICFQGGTAFNKAVWAAFENVTGKPVTVPDHHEVTGALGAAAIAAEYMKNTVESGKKFETSFKGFDNLIHIDYKVESFVCPHCPNNCEIKKVRLPQSKPLYYGSRCDRYNLRKETKKTNHFDAFEYRRQMLLKHAGLDTAVRHQDKKIGIPMALINHQLLPLFSRFFIELGFEPVISGRTNKKIVRLGLESVTAQPCYPVKIAHGHIAELLDKNLDYIFVPSIVSMTAEFPENRRNQLCPYVQSLGYLVQTAFADRMGKTRILTIPLRLGQGRRLLQKSFIALGEKLGVSPSEVKKSLQKAMSAQKEFELSLKEKGRQILSRLPADKKLFVLVSRPYNGCDETVNLNLPAKLADLGAELIPMDMLDMAKVELGDRQLHQHTYWSYGQKILRAAEIIKRDARLFAVYLSNFGCGPDSFLLTFFKDIILPKPALQLELDEHSADAGLITRLEAFLESLKHYRPAEQQLKPAPEKISTGKYYNRKRTLFIPYMSDCSYAVAACLRAYGHPAEVMPIADESVLLAGRRFTTGKECLPCAITAGEMLNIINTHQPDRTAFFMPSGNGPCRFGMYNCMHKLILKYAGNPNIPVISPNQDGSFYKEFAKSTNNTSAINFMKHIWAAAVGIDLLGKLILKIRPFADDPDFAEHIYQQTLRQWIQAVEKRKGIKQMRYLMKSIADEFSTIRLNHNLQKPTIGIVGEIYVRNHPFANMNIIARLEKLGAACQLSSTAEWIYYTNFIRSRDAKRKKHCRDLLVNRSQDYIQKKIERLLAEPLEKRFGRLAEEPVEKIIELAGGFLHPSFEGEAILSIGKTIEFFHNGIGGVVNVMPFSCMPSTIVSTLTRHISTVCNDMPILNLSFDGQEDAALATRLEAFVEQVRRRQFALSPASDLLKV